MTRRHSLTRLAASIVAFLLVAVSVIGQQPQDTLESVDTEEAQLSFTTADVFVELNDSDGDLGLHSSTTAPVPWELMKIIGPTGLLIEFTTRPELSNQGMSQVDFESAEPSFDELPPSRFFRRHPEGRYAIVAHGVEGERIKSYANLSHVLAAPPGNIVINGMRAAPNCDSPLPTVVAPVTISWDPVTTSHPRIGKSGNVRIARYQFFVERDTFNFGIDLPPSTTQFDIPAAMLAGAGTYKYEIIAQTTTGNNTAHESCFRIP
jgi:hypothetical protein